MHSTRSRWSIFSLILVAMFAAACSSDGQAEDEGSVPDSTDGTANETADPSGSDVVPALSATYSDPANWLCRPDVSGDACDIDLDATLVSADGTQTLEPFEAAVDAPVDCFYLYPTISTDEGANSDLLPGDAEMGIAGNQAARFAEVCNVYAPIYRQIPLGALFERIDDQTAAVEDGEESSTAPTLNDTTAGDIAYADVRDSFMHFLAQDNEGRPFVLIGHSQGTTFLNRLIAEEIDGNEALREQMLSAMLIGSTVTVDGGDNDSFENIAPCESPTDTSCVISYASFYAEEPPPPNSFFGRPRSGEGRALCSNPGDLTDNSAAPLNSYFQAGHTADTPEVDTPWVHYRGLIIGECTSDAEFDWLELTNTADTSSPLPGDLGGRISPTWGTHLVDVNFTIGDLIEIVRTQSGQA